MTEVETVIRAYVRAYVQDVYRMCTGCPHGSAPEREART
jgi:hypothetical protein